MKVSISVSCCRIVTSPFLPATFQCLTLLLVHTRTIAFVRAYTPHNRQYALLVTVLCSGMDITHRFSPFLNTVAKHTLMDIPCLSFTYL